MDYRNMNDEALRAACGDNAARWLNALRDGNVIGEDAMLQFITNIIEGSHDARAKVRAARGYPDKEDLAMDVMTDVLTPEALEALYFQGMNREVYRVAVAQAARIAELEAERDELMTALEAEAVRNIQLREALRNCASLLRALTGPDDDIAQAILKEASNLLGTKPD